jgi:cytochrome c oxidase subunit 2
MRALFNNSYTKHVHIIILSLLLSINSSFCDAGQRWQINIQDPATPIAEGMLNFHNYLMFFVISIGIFVFWLLYYSLLMNSKISNKFSHSNILEIIWTILPAIILIFIAIPSFSLLYSLDELSDPIITVKVVGHQWYWSYEYTDLFKNSPEDNNINQSFDSYMINTNDLTLGAFRLLEVDNRVVLPTGTHIRILVTSSDVLHSWAIPSFGIKVDAIPGRLSQASLYIKRDGIYYGQCSEICGINHGFMPIVISAVSPQNYLNWVSTPQ